MKHSLFHSIAMVIVASMLAVAGAIAQDRQSLGYTVVFSDQQGVTHFREETLPWQTSQTPDRRLPASLTPYLDAQKVGFLRLPVGFDADWHPAPSKRFVVLLSGTMELEVGDGQRRTFAAGSIVLVTDVAGRGHRTINIGTEDALAIWVPVP